VYFNNSFVVKEADFVYMRRKCSGKASNLAKGLFSSIATPSGENVTLDKKGRAQKAKENVVTNQERWSSGLHSGWLLGGLPGWWDG
jgi:hypothetical protein